MANCACQLHIDLVGSLLCHYSGLLYLWLFLAFLKIHSALCFCKLTTRPLPVSPLFTFASWKTVFLADAYIHVCKWGTQAFTGIISPRIYCFLPERQWKISPRCYTKTTFSPGFYLPSCRLNKRSTQSSFLWPLFSHYSPPRWSHLIPQLQHSPNTCDS